ncbi:MAG: HAD family hydrolase [Cyanobacteria bacterium P01_H01_bin.58]
MTAPTLLALDFDGVICDGLIEYFQTAWKAYCQLFECPEHAPPEGLAERFYPLRPVIETGWEMPLLIHALREGVKDEDVLQNWQGIVSDILTTTGIPSDHAMATVDGVRDNWIQSDFDGWLSLHRFYPGVIERIQQAIAAGIYPIVISTKEGRFIQALLAQGGLDLPATQIIGKEIKQPKTTTLRQLLQSPPDQVASPLNVWFVEDRLKTLGKVKAQAELADVTLFLVDWGYNTAAEREAAQHDSRVHLLSLAQVVREFAAWIG